MKLRLRTPPAAFGNRFGLNVETLTERFREHDASRVFVWLDVFAINQWDPGRRDMIRSHSCPFDSTSGTPAGAI